tara:strand:+ start:1791 stop:2294 length:504 start_codon:yes stop_codon:yes gene_type:complete
MLGFLGRVDHRKAPDLQVRCGAEHGDSEITASKIEGVTPEILKDEKTSRKASKWFDCFPVDKDNSNFSHVKSASSVGATCVFPYGKKIASIEGKQSVSILVKKIVVPGPSSDLAPEGQVSYYDFCHDSCAGLQGSKGWLEAMKPEEQIEEMATFDKKKLKTKKYQFL